MKKRVIFVSGLTTPPMILRFWREELEKHYPEQDIVVLGRFYTYLSIKKMEKLVETTKNLIEDEQETTLIGYSFGGIIIGGALNLAKKHNVTKVVTVASPNSMTYLGMKSRMEKLHYREVQDENIKKITFGAYIDPIVPKGYSHLPGSIHYNLWLDHFLFFWFSRKTMRKIFDTIDNT